MRAFVLIFLIATLPIRGVMGDAMLEPMDVPAHEAYTPVPCGHGPTMHHPCSGHACEMCQVVTLVSGNSVLVKRSVSHVLKPSESPQYVSVLLPPDLRPPIA
jgi:hypothetical protein